MTCNLRDIAGMEINMREDTNQNQDSKKALKLVVLERISLGSDVSLEMYEDFGSVTYYDNTLPDMVGERIKNTDIVIANKAPLNRDTLKGAQQLKLICETATGYNNVDLDYCRENNIGVCNVAGYSTQTVAQHTFAMALFLLEKLAVYDLYVKSGQYVKSPIFCHFEPTFNELSGKTWGIIGLGNIGKSVAGIARAFGCEVIYYSTSGRNSVSEYEQVSFDALLARSDIISLHCPLNEKTKKIMDKDAFAKMKDTAILINVARGPVVDEQALYDALKSGSIAAAGLDVLEKEPMDDKSVLNNITDSTKLLITPHMAWGSHEARTRCANEVYENIKAYISGEERNRIDRL